MRRKKLFSDCNVICRNLREKTEEKEFLMCSYYEYLRKRKYIINNNYYVTKAREEKSGVKSSYYMRKIKVRI